MTIFFISDTHFGHEAVIGYSHRPFANVEEMDAALIRNWNSRVTPADTIYHLGDFCFAKRERCEALLRQLNGHKFLIAGNHDDTGRKAKGWAWVGDMKELRVEVQPPSCDAPPETGIPPGEPPPRATQKLVLCHYAMRVWHGSHKGVVQLHGHSHGSLGPLNLAGYSGNSQQTDVGVDCWGYRPVTFEEIEERLRQLPPYHYPDHHQPRGDAE